MKIKKHIFTAAAACISLGISSCTNYLDIKPYDKVIPETPEEFSALLHNILNDIDEGDENYLVPNYSIASDFDVAFGDDFEVCLTEAGGSRLRTYLGNYIEHNGYYSCYSRLYEYIRNCNIIINEMEDHDSEEARNVFAAAYAMRGVAYYELIRQFCQIPDPANLDSQLGVPLVTIFDMEATPARASMATILNQIESDLKTSLSYNMTDPVYRFTPDVVKGYLGRLYFWSRRWEDCLGISREILAAHPLLDRDGFKTMMENFGKLTGNQLIKCYRSASVTGTGSLTGTTSNISYRPVSIRYLSNYYDDEKVTDIRYDMYVNSKRQIKKTVFCGMRGAEFKLMEAESLYHLRREPEALKSINEFRSYRIKNSKDIEMDNLPAVNSREIMKMDVNGQPITPLLALIQRERRKEFLLEYDRFFELKRNGCPEFTTYLNGTKYRTLSYMYTLPIPIHDMDIVDNLQQNPGYTEFVNAN